VDCLLLGEKSGLRSGKMSNTVVNGVEGIKINKLFNKARAYLGHSQ